MKLALETVHRKGCERRQKALLHFWSEDPTIQSKGEAARALLGRRAKMDR